MAELVRTLRELVAELRALRELLEERRAPRPARPAPPPEPRHRESARAIVRRWDRLG